MLADADERLCQSVIEKVESSTGYRPQKDEVREFLLSFNDSTKHRALIAAHPKGMNTQGKSKQLSTTEAQEKTPEGDGQNWYAINGEVRLRGSNAAKVTAAAFSELASRVPNFLEVYEAKAAEQKTRRKKSSRRWIAQRREDLYDNQKLMHASVEIERGWWLGTNYSNSDKRQMLSLAKEIAKPHGIELQFELV
jgi:hypothetical protein